MAALLADLYASSRFTSVKLSPAARKLFLGLALYEQDGQTMLWGKPVELAELPEGVWAQTDRGDQVSIPTG